MFEVNSSHTWSLFGTSFIFYFLFFEGGEIKDNTFLLLKDVEVLG